MDDVAQENMDLELQVIALCMRQEGAVEYFDRYLPEDDVGLPRDLKGAYELYRCLRSYHKDTGSDVVDPQGFRSWLETESDIVDAVGKEGLDVFIRPALEMELSTPQAVTTMLRRRARFERRKKLGVRLQEALEDPSDARGSEISRILEEMRGLNSDPMQSMLQSVYTGSDIAQRVDELYELPDFLETPYPKLNSALSYSDDGGLCKGAVYSIVATSGAGKSSLAKCMTNHWVEIGKNVLYINYEEAQSHWERILFTQITNQNPYTINQAPENVQANASALYTKTLEEWGDRLIVQHNPDTVFFEDMEQWVRDIAEERERAGHPLDAIVIDTIQSMFLRYGSGVQRWGQYEVMMVRLENLAKELDAAIIVTAQENNDRVKERREMVKQSDIGGSVTIVQKSTAVMVLVKKDVMTDPSMEESVIEVQIPKNRITGETFTLEPPILRFNDKTKSFEAVDITELRAGQDTDTDFSSVSDFFS